MIATLLIVTNLLTPIVDQIRVGAGHSVTAAYDDKFDMMYVTLEDWTDLKSIVETSDLTCTAEKLALEKEYSVQLAQSQQHCLNRVNALTMSLDKARDEIKLLQQNNNSLQSHNTLLKWISIGVASVSVGVTSYYIVR